jgi:methylenetetrahydrofolate reductase (NADPH)
MMSIATTSLQERIASGQPSLTLQEQIASGKPLLVAEISPPRGADPAPVRAMAKRFAGKVHALGISDNREKVAMAGLAAAALVAAEGIEPILHITTRDRNRTALVSEALGAQALGVRNLLCTSGSHQTLGRFHAAKNVYDIDSVQLLRAYSQLAVDCSLINEQGIDGAGAFCLGGVASPDADPLALQVSRLVKKVSAGAAFLITQPVFDLERFHAWWKAIADRGIPERVAILAGIQALPEAELAKAKEGKRSLFRIPQSTLDRVGSGNSPAERRAAAIEVALETIQRIAEVPGLRGFAVCGDCDSDAALAIIERSALGSICQESGKQAVSC